MRRREPVRPAGSEMPPELVQFDLAVWVPLVTEPEPAWWTEPPRGYPWVSFMARRLWMHARSAWEVEHGRGWWGATAERRARFFADEHNVEDLHRAEGFANA